MRTSKYTIIISFLFLSNIISAQTWKDEFNSGVIFANKGDYHTASQYFQRAILKFHTDTVSKDFATILYAIGDMYFQTEKYDTSLIYFERAFKLRNKFFTENDPEYEETISRIGAVKYRMGNYLEALILFKKDLSLTEKFYGNNGKEYTVAESNLANAYNKLGKYDTAGKHYIKVLKLKEQLFGKESTEYSQTLTQLANLYMTIGDYANAEPLCIEAIEIRKNISGTEHPYYVNNIIRLAQLYKNTGECSKSESLYLEALSIRRKTLGENNPDYISLLYDIGNVFLQGENYDQAEIYLLKSANKIASSTGQNNSEYAKTINALGVLYLAINDYQKAEKYFKESLAIREKSKDSNPKDYATALNNTAEFYRNIGNEEAFRFYEMAIEVYNNTGDTTDISYAKTINNLAIAYSMKENFEKAESLFIQALQIIKNKAGEKSSEYVQAMRNMGVFYLYFNIEKAEPFLLFCLPEENRLDNTQLIDLFSSLALIYEIKKDNLQAINYEIQSVQTQKKLISGFSYFMSTNQLDGYLFDNYKNILVFNNYLYKYSKEFSTLNEQSYNNELLLKGLILRNSQQVQNAILKSGDTALNKTLNEFRNIKNRLSNYYSLPFESRPGNIDELEADAEQLEKKLVQGSQAYRNLKEQFNITWKEVQNKLTANEAAIEFINFDYYNKKWTDSVLYGALVLRPGYKEPKFVYLFEQKQLEELLQKTSGIADSTYFNILYQYSKKGKGLEQLIWEPLDSLLKGVTTIFSAPSGLLHTINISALPVRNNLRLGEQYQLHIVGTTGDIIKRKEQYLNNSTIQKAWLFGGIDYDKTSNTEAKIKPDNIIGFGLVADNTRGLNNSWPFLKNTLFESAGIDSLCRQKNIQTEFFSGSSASETEFKNISGEPSEYMIHLATHGYFFPDIKKKPEDKPLMNINSRQAVYKLSDNPLLRSGLIFSGANKTWSSPNYSSDSTDDGILTAYEISNLDLSEAKLVVMSACETGLGEIKGSEGVFGLQRSFKLAGAENIIMSLWEVPDVQTKELMKLFYENCFKGMTISDALKNAQFTMSEKYPPYYWAAFKLLE